MACIKWSQPIFTSFGWDAIPAGYFSLKKFEREPQNRPLFFPTARPYPLNTLTYCPPPMYWLGTSRWCLGPLCVLHFVWTFFFLAFTPFLLPPFLFDSTIHSGWCLSFVAWRMCGLLDSCSLPFISSLAWALLRQRPSSSCWAHAFLFYVNGPFGYWSYHITLSYLL